MTWSVVKEAIGKNSSRRQNFPNKIDLGSKFIASTDSIDESLINISITSVISFSLKTPWVLIN